MARNLSRIEYDEDSVLSIRRDVYTKEHEEFRKKVRSFLAKEIAPHINQWVMNGRVDKSAFVKAAQDGTYCRFSIPVKYGGLGLSDYRYNAVVNEELIHVDCTDVSFTLGTDIVLPYFLHRTNDEQKQRYLPRISQGAILAIAMSEPQAGSDLVGVSCSAVRDGDHYVLNGRKMWISNGAVCDLVVVVAVTNPDKGHNGLSLLVVERGMEGFETARVVKKLGRHAQDTALLTFENCRVPASNLLGVEGMGFKYLMHGLPQERLQIAVDAMAGARRALALTINHCHGREAFGKPIGTLQYVHMKLAEMKTEIQIGTTFVDKCVAEHAEGRLSTESASMAKWWVTDLCNRVTHQCLQFHGGYGYLAKSPIGKLYADQRVTMIYGGANEVMKEIIAKGMGFRSRL